MLIDFARLPTVQSDDEEKYAYLDYQHGVDWGPVKALKFGVKYTDHDRGSLWMSTEGGAFLPLACGAAPCTAPDFEIGRASRRERVCKYVKISVVTVSLTKKKTLSLLLKSQQAY